MFEEAFRSKVQIVKPNLKRKLLLAISIICILEIILSSVYTTSNIREMRRNLNGNIELVLSSDSVSTQVNICDRKNLNAEIMLFPSSDSAFTPLNIYDSRKNLNGRIGFHTSSLLISTRFNICESQKGFNGSCEIGEEENDIQLEVLISEDEVETVPEISPYAANDCYYYYISPEDKLIIAKVVYVESRGESLEGKVAVAAVILNRYYSGLPEFNTESIYAVSTQGFASIKKVTMEDLDNYPECMEAVEAACKGWDPTRKLFSEGAKFFYAPKRDIDPYQRAIRQGIEELVIGNHNFHNDFNMENVEERVQQIIAEQAE